MKTAAGIWIDHRKAIVVTIANKSEKTVQVVSDVEKQLGRIEGRHSTSSFESGPVPADDRQQSGFTKHLKDYYDKVLLSIHDAETILLFGPGEAKGELKKHLEQTDVQPREVFMETADTMSDRQVAARVRHYFSNSTLIK